MLDDIDEMQGITDEEKKMGITEIKNELHLLETQYPNIENNMGLTQKKLIKLLEKLQDSSFQLLIDAESNDADVHIEKIHEDFDNIIKIDIDKFIESLKIYKKKINTAEKAMRHIQKQIARRQNQLHGKVKMDDSTQMRHDFVKKYVHEYFIEFMEDYFSYENVFLCDD